MGLQLRAGGRGRYAECILLDMITFTGTYNEIRERFRIKLQKDKKNKLGFPKINVLPALREEHLTGVQSC